MTDWETQKKTLLPYLQRAAEIESVDPKVAYYCRLYAVEQGIKLEQRDQKADDLLELVLNQLEKDKPYLTLDTNVDLGHCERFAMGVYIKAKRRDEQGIADRDTAKAYYAAFNFIEILKQFGPLSEEVEKERRFAVFRAAEIKRHLDEGKQPPPLVPIPEEDAPAAGPGDVNEPRTEGLPLSTSFPPRCAPESIAVVDYDPGYVIGSRTLLKDETSNAIHKGIIKSKAAEVGGFFNIQAEDGSEHQLGALFMAPDLAEGDSVMYYSSDGRQTDCTVKQTLASEWPPMYVLLMEDGSTVSVRHSSFTLNHISINEPQSPDAEPSLSSPPQTPAKEDNPDKSAEAKSKLQKRESWLIPKDSSKRVLCPSPTAQPGSPIPQPTIPGAPPAQGPSAVGAAGMPVNVHRLPELHQNQMAYPPRTLADYYQDSSDYFSVDSPKMSNAQSGSRFRPSPIQPRPQPKPLMEKQPGFEPDAAAVKQATKCTHNAAAALNFSDVDHAIHCLQEALKLLTQPSSS